MNKYRYVVVPAQDMFPGRDCHAFGARSQAMAIAKTYNDGERPWRSHYHWKASSGWDWAIIQELIIEPPTDAEIVAAYEKFMHKEAIGPSVGGIDLGTHIVSMELARAAWSRELKRRVVEADRKRQLPCQGTLPEDL